MAKVEEVGKRDHRRPCDSFDLNDEEQKYMCFHWTNFYNQCGVKKIMKKATNMTLKLTHINGSIEK